MRRKKKQDVKPTRIELEHTDIKVAELHIVIYKTKEPGKQIWEVRQKGAILDAVVES